MDNQAYNSVKGIVTNNRNADFKNQLDTLKSNVDNANPSYQLGKFVTQTINPFYYAFQAMHNNQPKPSQPTHFDPATFQNYGSGSGYDIQGGGNYDTPLQGGYLQQAPVQHIAPQTIQNNPWATTNMGYPNNADLNQSGSPTQLLMGSRPGFQPINTSFQELPLLKLLGR